MLRFSKQLRILNMSDMYFLYKSIKIKIFRVVTALGEYTYKQKLKLKFVLFNDATGTH